MNPYLRVQTDYWNGVGVYYNLLYPLGCYGGDRPHRLPSDRKADSLHCCGIHFGELVVVLYEVDDGGELGSHVRYVNGKGLRHLADYTLLHVYDDNPSHDEEQTPCGALPNDEEDNMGFPRVLNLNSLN